jgi:hypothetical protein
MPMFEIIALFTVVGAFLAVVLTLALAGAAFKILFKLVLLPFWLLGFALKALALVIGVAVALVLAPVLLIVLVVLAPLLAVGGLIGLGVWAVA